MGLDSELRISPRALLGVLLGLAVALFLAVQFLLAPREISDPVMTILLVVMGLVAAGWAVTSASDVAGRWFAVLALLAAVHVAHIALHLPAALSLAAIPVAISVSLLGAPYSILFAAAETALLIGLLRFGIAGMDVPYLAIALTAIWGTLGMMVASLRPYRHLSEWVEEYFSRAQRSLEEARERKLELEQAMEKLAHSNRQLALAGERMAALRRVAEDAQRAKTAFVANVSHEFRTPLNMIIGLVDLMVETPAIYDVVPSPKLRDDLRVVHRNCEHLATMVDDVLDLSRLESGRMALHRERVDLGEIVDTCVRAVQPLLDKKGLSVEVRTEGDVPAISCDRTRIKQVILNLLSNAARFTEEGGIEIALVRRDRQVVVSVADTGPGIAPGDAERIFEPFYQGSQHLWRDKSGSGLGLSISKRFVELHGGRMWLESEREVGTCFLFELPISAPVGHMGRPGHQIREDWEWRERAFLTDGAASAEDLAQPRIIVCDETGTLVDQFSHYAQGIEVVDTRTLDEVSQALNGCPAHAIVVNSVTSGDVWQMLASAADRVRETPLIGCSVPPAVARAEEAGAKGHLVKPVTRADLARALTEAPGPVRSVLVVDDDPDVQQLFSRMLLACDESLEVTTTDNGWEALAVLREGGADLLLLDAVMPEMDGWEMFERMRLDETVPDVPTYFISAQDPVDHVPVSEYLVATVDNGLPPSTLLRCSLELSGLLLAAGGGTRPAPL